jgi:uncharacterized membrane protein SirB2
MNNSVALTNVIFIVLASITMAFRLGRAIKSKNREAFWGWLIALVWAFVCIYLYISLMGGKK